MGRTLPLVSRWRPDHRLDPRGTRDGGRPRLEPTGVGAGAAGLGRGGVAPASGLSPMSVGSVLAPVCMQDRSVWSLSATATLADRRRKPYTGGRSLPAFERSRPLVPQQHLVALIAPPGDDLPGRG